MSAVQRTLSNLQAALEKGDYYGALQMYRTLVKRKLDSGSMDESSVMVREGASALVQSGRFAEGADLFDLFVKSYESTEEVISESSVGRLKEIASVFPSTSPEACAAAAPVLRAAARWATNARLTPGGPKPGVSDAEESEKDWDSRRGLTAVVHGICATACEGAGLEFAADASRHYLEAGDPTRFAKFLFSWAQRGYSGEGDLFLARAVLQLLVLGRLGEGNAVRDEFVRLVETGGSEVSISIDSPLSNFIKFLLLACEVSSASCSALLTPSTSCRLPKDVFPPKFVL